ncbi:Energy-coupling factor transporter transmembrane protein BioN [Acidipropionibacterium jensenii]|uniref:Energy-coupling factor transporter transmembrane protein BioN n=2 Tax=Acidipropionibacterium jensenii TaxID=1749 RepID=A0A3S4UQI9_9ACTN|nr:Energy-coupling factor transporter transmembrane protein BioN [Acidipropionibacterium jensenii]
MNGQGDVERYLGVYVPGHTPAHRMPVWAKYLMLVVVGVLPFILRIWWFSLVCLAAAVVIVLVVARLPRRLALRIGTALWIMNGLILGYHVVFNTWQRGVVYVASLMACLYMARMLTCTTSTDTLMDAIAGFARILRPLGVSPEKVALAVTLMWATVPYLLGSFLSVRDSARARGMERSSWRFVVPVIVGIVGHALEVGDALRARGLGDEPQIRAGVR